MSAAPAREDGAGLDPALLLAALPDPVIAVDRRGAIRFVNPAAEQFLGHSAAALRGATLADFFVADSPLFGLVEAAFNLRARAAHKRGPPARL